MNFGLLDSHETCLGVNRLCKSVKAADRTFSRAPVGALVRNRWRLETNLSARGIAFLPRRGYLADCFSDSLSHCNLTERISDMFK